MEFDLSQEWTSTLGVVLLLEGDEVDGVDDVRVGGLGPVVVLVIHHAKDGRDIVEVDVPLIRTAKLITIILKVSL